LPTLALIGNPNTGKTTLFNALTGLSQRVGNYPGVTVEHKVGTLTFSDGAHADLVDLPGTYSLSAHSPDEAVVVDALLGQIHGSAPIDAILYIADATNVRRNFYLLSQLVESDVPIVIALNMTDLADARSIRIDAESISQRLGLAIIPVAASRGQGLDTLREAVQSILVEAATPRKTTPALPSSVLDSVRQIQTHFSTDDYVVGHVEALRMLVDAGSELETRGIKRADPSDLHALDRLRDQAFGQTEPAEVESQARYAWINHVLEEAVEQVDDMHATPSDRIDDVLTHRLWGIGFFALLNAVVFQAIYAWSGPLMDAIDSAFVELGESVGGAIPAGPLQSLVVDGIISGVGGVLIFLPQIAILFFCIAILEDCGYMARAAMLMDRALSFCGLSGKSFIPLLSGFACAIPGIMATRTIADRRDRLATMLVVPLMSCSARLPVYILFIAAFVPEQSWANGWINLQGIALLAFYSLGLIVAIPIAFLLKKTLLKGASPAFLLELPSYKWPNPRTVFLRVYHSSRDFVLRAGSIILATTIAMWALAYFPRDSDIAAPQPAHIENGEQSPAELSESQRAAALLEASYLGRAGHVIEPIVKPLGWDWRIGVAVIASFPAREVVVSTLGTIYSLGGDQDEESEALRTAMRNAVWPDGRKVFNVPVALSIMVFFALCAQCAATIATIKRETLSWRWAAFSFFYMTGLAYVGAFCTYQVSMALGWGG
jgi:ferrous iron transport protein B